LAPAGAGLGADLLDMVLLMRVNPFDLFFLLQRMAITNGWDAKLRIMSHRTKKVHDPVVRHDWHITYVRVRY
jgi:hypothetical protein